MKDKDELLKQLELLGIDPDKKVRKPRSDAGLPRGIYKPRSDKGKQRGSYINTAAKYKAVYDRMLNSHFTGEGADNLTRDKNDIFPPDITRYYKHFTGTDRDYVASTNKTAHLEQARWRWLMAEYNEDPAQWRAHIAKWYFIKEDEIDLWMYTEWAWAYVNHIGGLANRLIEEPLILSYQDYLAGKYNGYPEFDERGEIIWRSK